MAMSLMPDDNKVKNIITPFNLSLRYYSAAELKTKLIFIESSTLFIDNLATFTAKCN